MEINKNTSLFGLSWPIFCQMLLAMGIGYVDQLMLSRYSESAPGAVGNACQILGFLTLAFTIISSASGVIISQYLGAGLKDKMSRIYTLSVWFNLVISVIISLIVFIGGKYILTLMKVPAELLPEASGYLKILGGFVFVEALFDAFAQIFRSNGRTQIGMVVSLLINVLNIAGNYCFLYGPLSFLNLGVKGVAISSVFSKIIALIVVIFYFRKHIEGTVSIKYIRPFPKNDFKKLIKLGVPTAGENISYNVSQLVILAIINSMGTVAINTKIFANILCGFTYLYSVSVAVGTQIIVGHEVGAGDYDDAYKRVIKTLVPAIFVSQCMAWINYFASGFTYGLFAKNADVIGLGHKIMFIAIFLELGRTTNLVVINSMRASGDVKFPTMLGIISMWGISVAFAFIFGKVLGMGLVGVWIAMALDEIVRGVVVIIRWIRGGWRGKSVVMD